MKATIPYRWELLAWLWMAFFLNQADRQIFGVVLPLIQADLALTDLQAGLVASVFTATMGLLVPVAGYAGDVLSRNRIVTASVLTWSAATLLTGFSTGLWCLILVRSLATALGETFYAPSSNALISENFVETRAQAMSIHQTSLYVGVIASGWLAGYLGQRFGWRAAFWLFGAVGVGLALVLARRLRHSAPVRPADRVPPLRVARILLRRPTVVFLALGFAGMVFVNIGYLTWTPTYLHERFGLSLANAGFSSMFYHHAGAFLGVLAGGRLSDRMALRRPVARPFLQAAALAAGAPFIYLIGAGESFAAVCLALGCFGFFRGIYDSSIYAALYEVIEPRFHASAASINIAFAFTTGALAPLALGAARQAIGLAAALSWLSAVYIAAAVSIFIAARFFFQTDRKQAQTYA